MIPWSRECFAYLLFRRRRNIVQMKYGADYDYLPNPLGNVKRTIATGQSLRQQYLYSPWEESDPVSDDENASTPFQFIGAYGGRTQDVGGVYFRARTYSPTYARWINVDQLWPRQFAYLYSHASPASRKDPGGLKPLDYSCAAIRLTANEGPKECLVRNSPTGEGYELYAYKFAQFDCILRCPRDKPCGCYAPTDPDIHQWKTGHTHYWPTPIQRYDHEDDGSQHFRNTLEGRIAYCPGPTLIDSKKCLYQLKGADSPGFWMNVADSMGRPIYPDCGPPGGPGSRFATFGYIRWLDVDVQLHFDTCCGDPEPGIKYPLGCEAITQWSVKMRVQSSMVGPGNGWYKCEIE